MKHALQSMSTIVDGDSNSSTHSKQKQLNPAATEAGTASSHPSPEQ
jgi:hypothetical protein